MPTKETFCTAPYQHTCIDSKGYLKVCCVSKETPEYKYDQLEEWYHSPFMNELRENLDNGVKHPNCEVCWKSEQSKKGSQRNWININVGNIFQDNFDISFKQNKDLQQSIEKLDYKNIKSFDLKLGNLCNLKCIMCWADSSSQLLAEAQLNPELKQFYGDKNARDYMWAESDQFKEWCLEHLPNSINIKFTGGEPMINPHLLPTLEHIPDEQKKKCKLHFTTNATVINQKLIDTLNKFQFTEISISVEGLGEVLEYARYGHKWKDLEHNLNYILENRSEKISVRILNVLQAPTFLGIRDLVEYFDKKQITIYPLFLRHQSHLDVGSIKKSYKEDFLKQTENYKGFNLKYMSAIRHHIIKNLDHNKDSAKQCVYHLQSIDNVRKNNFQNIIPIDYFV